MGRLRAGQALGDLPDSLLSALLDWYEMAGASSSWVECHQEITRRLHDRNTGAPDQHIHAKEESSQPGSGGREPAPGGDCHPSTRGAST